MLSRVTHLIDTFRHTLFLANFSPSSGERCANLRRPNPSTLWCRNIWLGCRPFVWWWGAEERAGFPFCWGNLDLLACPMSLFVCLSQFTHWRGNGGRKTASLCPKREFGPIYRNFQFKHSNKWSAHTRSPSLYATSYLIHHIWGWFAWNCKISVVNGEAEAASTLLEIPLMDSFMLIFLFDVRLISANSKRGRINENRIYIAL